MACTPEAQASTGCADIARVANEWRHGAKLSMVRGESVLITTRQSKPFYSIPIFALAFVALTRMEVSTIALMAGLTIENTIPGVVTVFKQSKESENGPASRR
jgi:hypothetical protein